MIVPMRRSRGPQRSPWYVTLFSLILGQKGAWEGTPPADWLTFAQRGYLPHAAPLQFVFRALTPPGRPRRFDARFFLVDAEDIATDLDNFDDACDELSHLQWVALSDARKFDMPFITEVAVRWRCACCSSDCESCSSCSQKPDVT